MSAELSDRDVSYLWSNLGHLTSRTLDLRRYAELCGPSTAAVVEQLNTAATALDDAAKELRKLA